jgi:hypothetical protein
MSIIDFPKQFSERTHRIRVYFPSVGVNVVEAAQPSEYSSPTTNYSHLSTKINLLLFTLPVHEVAMSNNEEIQSRGLFDSINSFLDHYVLPWPVRFLTFRFVIIITIALLIPLIIYANSTVLVLSINSYLNTMSVAVSSIVLLYATISEARQKQIAELQEKRAQEDHQHVTEMHTLILQQLQNQQQEIQELKQLISVISGNSYHAKEQSLVPDLYALHPRGAERFQANEHQDRMQKQLHHNHLVSTIREDLK